MVTQFWPCGSVHICILFETCVFAHWLKSSLWSKNQNLSINKIWKMDHQSNPCLYFVIEESIMKFILLMDKFWCLIVQSIFRSPFWFLLVKYHVLLAKLANFCCRTHAIHHSCWFNHNFRDPITIFTFENTFFTGKIPMFHTWIASFHRFLTHFFSIGKSHLTELQGACGGFSR